MNEREGMKREWKRSRGRGWWVVRIKMEWKRGRGKWEKKVGWL